MSAMHLLMQGEECAPINSPWKLPKGLHLQLVNVLGIQRTRPSLTEIIARALHLHELKKPVLDLAGATEGGQHLGLVPRHLYIPRHHPQPLCRRRPNHHYLPLLYAHQVCCAGCKYLSHN